MAGYQLGGPYNDFANDTGGDDMGSSDDYGFDPLDQGDPESVTPDVFSARFAMLSPGEQGAFLQAFNPAVAGILMKLLGESFMPALDQMMAGAGVGPSGPGALPPMGGGAPPMAPSPPMGGLRGIQAGQAPMPQRPRPGPDEMEG
jgi:hypothetical protein